MKNSKKIPEDVFSNLSEKDFDGHTEFKSLTPKKRLQWLSQMSQFLWKVKSQKADKKK